MTYELPRGVYQLTPGGVFQIKRKVPVDLQQVLSPGVKKVWLKASAKTSDPRLVQAARDHQWRRWDALIAEARGQRRRAGEVTFAVATEAIEHWRRSSCMASSLLRIVVDEDRPVVRTYKGSGEPAPSAPSFRFELAEIWQDDLEGTARRHLQNVGRDSMPDLLRIGKLQAATTNPEGWRQIDGFDKELDRALEWCGVKGRLAEEVRAALRARYVLAALEVTQHREASRQKARAIITFVELRPDTIRLESRASAYQPCVGDRTLGELIKAFRAARVAEHGDESTDRRYAHIFAALEQTLGSGQPVRAITRKDCQRVRDLFRVLPANATKKFKGLSLEQAIEAADALDLEADGVEEMVPRIKPKTLETYMASLSRVFNWGIDEADGWLEVNHARGLAGEKIAQVQRRGFTCDELTEVIRAIADERSRNSWKFWVPVLGNYTGARLGELVQIRREDIKSVNGVTVLHITRFDLAGRLDTDKRLKTAMSERMVPLHQDLLDAGFLDFVAAQPAGRLFPTIPERRGGLSHEPSKWFASLLDQLDMADPCLVFHSFRHGFRDACDEANIHPDKRRALGGWASLDVADKYGNRSAVRMLSKEVAKLQFPSVRAALGLQLSARARNLEGSNDAQDVLEGSSVMQRDQVAA